MYANVTGNGNTGLGYAALKSNVGGHQITAVGYLAGGSVTGSNFSTFLGNQAGFDVRQNVDPYNSMALGNGSYTTKNNQVVIGNANVVETLLRGNVGIGTAAPRRNWKSMGRLTPRLIRSAASLASRARGRPPRVYGRERHRNALLSRTYRKRFSMARRHHPGGAVVGDYMITKRTGRLQTFQMAVWFISP